MYFVSKMRLNDKNLKIEVPDRRLLTSLVADKLRNLIVSGQLKSGRKLNEVELAEAMGVSRFPIRSALHILELEGLVSLVPRRGAFVAEMLVDEVKEIYEIKSMIEGYAAGLVAENITEGEITELESILKKAKICIKKEDFEGILDTNYEFHEKIVQNGKNKKLFSFYKSLVLPIKKYQSYSLSPPWSPRISLEEHWKILEAISKKENSKAEQLAREHVWKAGLRVRDRLLQENQHERE